MTAIIDLDQAAEPGVRNFHRNDCGGVTYAPAQRVGQPEARSDLLADVRALADATHDLCAAHRNFWPQPHPIPEDVHCALLAADYGLARVRGGTLKRLAEQDSVLALHHEPDGAYLSTADLIEIRHAAGLLETCRTLLVDRPGEQQQLQRQAQTLREIVDRATERAWGMKMVVPGKGFKS